MYRIMYISTAIVNFSDDELNELLNIARKNNSKKNLTGLLVVKGRTFLQCLEGEKNNVLEVFEKIKNDSRHKDIFEIIEDESSDNRYFPDWSMGYKNIKYLTDIKSNKLKDFTSKKDLETLSKDYISEVFKEFIETD
uniref:BLUF domain-containing protein n=1 Tax=Aliarcobacter sp. TaxID=2321116 RepID=UPI0040476E9E